MLDSILVYLALLITVTGLVSLVRPMPFLRIRTRSRATITAVVGLLLVIVTLLLPVRTKQVSIPTTRLDEWMPIWQFDERHTIHVDVTPEKAFAAVHAVRADEILFFRTLMAIRRCGRPGPERMISAPEKKPLLQVATQTTFVYLADDSPRELVVGTVVAAPPGKRPSGKPKPAIFHQTLPPGFALATMNFLVTPDGRGGSTVVTVTRIYAEPTSALRRFAVYWRLIHPGSDILRRMWLRAIKRQAEEVG